MYDIAYAPNAPDIVQVISPPYRDVLIGDTLYPRQIFTQWSEAELNSKHFYYLIREVPQASPYEQVQDLRIEFTGGRFYERGSLAPRSDVTELAKQAVAEARRWVEDLAEHKREEYLTPGVVKQQVYAEKRREAERFAAGDTGPFPWAEARSAITGQTVPDVLAEWKAKADALQKRGVAIEAAYDRAVRMLENAPMTAGVGDYVQGVKEQFAKDLEAIP